MQLTKDEQQYLRLRKPFEGLVWRIGKDGIPCCLIKVPSRIPFDMFSLILDSLEFSSSSGSVILLYGVSSYRYDVVKSNLTHVFDLAEEDDCQLLQRISRGKWINVCGYSEKGLMFLNSKQVELKPKLLSRLEAILRNHKALASRQQVAKAPKSESKQVKSKAQRVFVPLQAGELLRFPLIERCRYQLQRDIQQLSSQDMKITRQVFWRLLLIASLEQARSFTLYSDAANMIEQKRLTLKHSNWPVLTPEFPIPHLWFSFFQPIKTPVCHDTAAIFLFSANDSSLLEHSPMLRDSSEVLYDKVYEHERDLFSLNVVNTHGKIVWSMSLPTTVEEAKKHLDQLWLVPAWFQCPHHACQSLRDHEVAGEAFYSYQLCEKCRHAQLFFSTWLMTAWQALMGAYRDEDLDTIGSGRVEYFQMASSYLRNIGLGRNEALEHRYRIISYKDISKGLNSPWHSVLRPTSSWVEVLMASDPESITWQERVVLPHYRILSSPRYKEPGKKIPVRSHIRNTPMRTDHLDMPRETKVRAERFDYEDEE